MDNLSHSDFDSAIKVQLGLWQGLLKLNDWDIKIDYWPHDALGENTLAKILWSRDQKTATIAIRVPNDIPSVERNYPDDEAADYDVTLLHELLHLKCVDMECKVEWAEEQLVNHVSRALVKLYRENTKVETAGTPAEHGHYI